MSATRTRATGVLLLGTAIVAAACSEPSRDTSFDSTSTEGHEGTDTGATFDSRPADQCVAAPSARAGRHTGSLRNKTADRGGACGRGGPDAFVAVDLPRRADVRLSARGVGFVPVVGARSRCELSWAETQLSCTQGHENWVLDMPAGSTLLVSVGIEPDDPALASTPTPGLADPLDFILDVQMRAVLLEGEPCEPASRGRCVSGTACLPVEQDDGVEVTRCVALAGDTCASAIPVAVERGRTVVIVEDDVVHTDAHAHTCGGGRRPERVLALGLPSGLEPGAQLEVRTDAPDVWLALRGPGCAADEELACAADSGAGTLAVVEDLAAVGSPTLFLFVELPRSAQVDDDATDGHETTTTGTGELPPLIIEIDLSDA